uniref:NYN domain-containing protein n=1 Tax=Brassica oleracea var. oleracea TaxID=109376 RepID=A0A0D3AHQ4_BRAOL
MGEDDTIGFEALKQTLVYWNMDDYPIPVDTTDELDPVFGDILKALDVMGFRNGHIDVYLYSEQINREEAVVDWTLPEMRQTLVYWNIDDYPIPTDDLDPVFGDILKALHVMGFRNGYIDVYLYSEQINCEAIVTNDFLGQGEYYCAFGYKVLDITLYMIRHASCIGPGPANYFVIAKPKRELHRVLHCLQSRRHNVLLVKPPPPDEEFLFSVASLLENARFLGGGKPRFKELYASHASEYDISFEKYVEIKEDVSKMVDFSERIPTVRGPRTAVFWDAVDYPFPPSSTPDEIYHSISSALVERYFSDNITIWAYLDDDDDDKKGSALLGGDKTWTSRIYFLPGGDKASRRIRMLNDMFLLARDSPQCSSYDASLVLFADQFIGAAYYINMLQRLDDIRYHILLVTPTLDINKPETPQWPGLLMDRGAASFALETSKISEAHAAAEEEETPKKLDTHGKLLLETEDMKKPESS